MNNRTRHIGQRRIGRLLGGLLALILLAPARAAVVDHSGTLAAGETWSTTDVHRITGTVTVPDGLSLTIEPGAILKFSTNTGLTVSGRLDAVGTAAEPIVFTSYRDDSAGGDTNGDGPSSGAAGDWSRLYFTNTADNLSRLEQVEIRYGGGTSASLYIYQTSPSVADSVIRDGKAHGIYAYGAAPVLTNLTVSGHTKTGIVLTGSPINLSGHTVRDNGESGIYVASGSVGRIENNTVTGNAASGLYIANGAAEAIEGNTLTGNGGYGVYFGSTGGATPALTGNVITGNGDAALRVPFSALPNAADGNVLSPNGRDTVEFVGNARGTDLDLAAGPVYWQVGGSATVDAGAALTLAPGVVWKSSTNTGLTVSGRLDAVGTAAEPIVFTSYRDDSAGGDTNGDGPSSGAAGDWSRLYFTNTADNLSRLEQVEIRYGGGTSASLYIYQTSPTISNSTIASGAHHGVYSYFGSPSISSSRIWGHQANGIYISGGSPTIEFSEISSNLANGIEFTGSGTPAISGARIFSNRDLGIYNRSATTLTVSDTWWGDWDGSGPHHPTSNPSGTGSEVSDNVDYTGYLAEAPIEYGYSNLQEGGIQGYGILPPAVLNQGTLSNEWDAGNAAPERTMAHDPVAVELGFDGLDPARSYKARVGLFNGDAGYTAALKITSGSGALIADGIRVPYNALPTQHEFAIAPAYYASGQLALRFVNDSAGVPGTRVAVPELWIIETGDLSPAVLAAVDYNDSDGSGTLSEGDQYRFRFSSPMDITLIQDGTTDANTHLTPDGGLIYGSSNTVSWSADRTTVTVTLTAGFTIAGTEQVTLSNLFDHVGNPVSGTAQLGLTDTVPPVFEAVEWNDVDSGNSLSAGDTLRFVFSEVMNTGSISSGGDAADTQLAVIGGGSYGTPNQAAWSADGRSVTVTIVAGFDLQGNETVDPRDTVTDVAGNPVLGTQHIGAIDQEPPLIQSLRFDDRDGNGTVSVGDRYLFRFSEPMYATALRDGTTDANVHLSPGGAVYGTVNTIAWDDGDTLLTVSLTAGFTLAGTEQVTPSASVTDLAGNQVANTATLTTQDTVEPLLDSVTANAPDPITPRPDYRLTLHFDGAMDSAVTPHITLTGGTTAPSIPATGSWSTAAYPNDTYTTGDIAIDESHEGTWSIGVDGATDPAGNAMQPTEDAFSFTVVGVLELTVSQFDPAPEVNHWNHTLVTLQGNRDPLTAIRINGTEAVAPGTATWSTEVELAEGSNTLTVTAVHTGGQIVGTVELLFEVDTQPPPPPEVDAYPAETTLSVLTFSGSKEADSGLWLNGTQVLAPDADTRWQFSRALALGLNTFSLTARDLAGNPSTPVTLTVTRQAIADTGPDLSDPRFAGEPLADGAVLTQSGELSVNAVDDSGVSHVEFYLDDTLLSTDNNGSDGYSATLDLVPVSDGTHLLRIRAEDSLGNASELVLNVNVELGPPPAPVLTAPLDGLTTNAPTVTLAGTALPGSEVLPYRNGTWTGAAVATDDRGGFSTTVAIEPGANVIQAAARHRGGEGPLSDDRTVLLDESRPDAPSGLSATVKAGGQVDLAWTGAPGEDVVGYHVYRSTSAFESTSEATRINAQTVVDTRYTDQISDDGVYYYRVTAVNAVGTESLPSNMATASLDTTPPRALSILYTPQGASDPATGRVAQGRVDIDLSVSEPLLTTPFLSLATDGGAPLTAVLERVDDTRYQGYVEITPYAGTGTAYAVFSARDLAGNRGTAIDAGTTLEIDTKGPYAVRIDSLPAHPIRNDAAAPVSVQLTLELDEPAGAGLPPELGVKPSLSGEQYLPVSLVQIGDLLWQGSITLPADAGQEMPELLLLSYFGVDDLGNESNSVLDTRRIQVYQGDLPPLEVPADCNAEALPDGQVLLNWQAVDEAVDYQLFRQGPDETELTALALSGGELSWLDTPPQDGVYRYGVASVRTANDQQSLGAPCANLEVAVDALAPPAPTGLSLALQGAGIDATWTAPVTDEAVSYRLYRDSVDPIVEVAGLTPVLSDIAETHAVDPAPLSGLYAYAVTAVDEAGNESPPSNTAYLNFDLLPVSGLSIDLAEDQLPVLSWTHPSPVGVDHYNLYLGTRATGILLNPAPLYDTLYSDSAYTGGERLYTLVAVDAAGSESVGRSLLLPDLALEPLGDGELYRGIMNRLQYQVTNRGDGQVRGARLQIGAGGHDHLSEPFDLAAGQAAAVPVIIGGYAELGDPEPLTLTLTITPNEGERVTLVRHAGIPVGDAGLTLAVAVQEMLRGGTGQVRFTLENSSEVELELITARSNGQADSGQVLLKLLDPDANVLAAARLRQSLGSGVVTLTDGTTVARIPAGGRFTSDWVPLVIPAAAPDSVTVQVDIDALHYHYGQPNAVSIAGVSGRRDVPLVDTPYYGVLDQAAPQLAYAGQTVTLAGRALDRGTGTAVAHVPLNLVLGIQGFERVIEVMTDAAGAFSHNYLPPQGEAGVYRVSVVHPDLVERPEHGRFTVAGLSAKYDLLRLSTARNYDQQIGILVTASEGSAFTGLRLEMQAADQPGGFLPAGITLTEGPRIDLADGASSELTVTFRADDGAAPEDTLVLRVVADQLPGEALDRIQVAYRLVDAAPVLIIEPAGLATGVTVGASVTETLTISNRGLFDAEGVQVALADPGGTVPSWMRIASESALGTLAVGESRELTLVFAPGTDVPSAEYPVLLQASAANAAARTATIGVTVTPSGEGQILFKAEDIYTNTQTADGSLITGLEGATIRLQHEQLATIGTTVVSGAGGEVLTGALPAGSYRYRASAPNHTDATGRVQVRAGIVSTGRLFLDYQVVTVEWSVTETTIEDEYQIILSATYAVNVPTAVIALEPASVSLPFMQAGDVFYGELTLSNLGLIRAFNVRLSVPQGDAYLRYELLIDSVPNMLEAKQRVVIPYRITALRDLTADDSGGGCFIYVNSVKASGDSICANGDSVTRNASTGFTHRSGSTCSSSSGSGGGTTSYCPQDGCQFPGGSGGGGGGAGVVLEQPSGLPPCRPDCVSCSKGGFPGGGKGGSLPPSIFK